MDKTAILNRTEKFVRNYLKDAEKGHDWWHIQRVCNNTQRILRSEQADTFICTMSALLHDINDRKFRKKAEGPDPVAEFLHRELKHDEWMQKILFVVNHVSFSGGLKKVVRKTPELEVVQDADRLDAMGAIGIARAFHYGGYKNRVIYDPAVKPVDNYQSVEEYYNDNSPTLNHFYHKLLKLKDLMNTPTGRKMAVERHEFMLMFLDRFNSEWEG
jgi:uncharacterized protein